MPKDTPMRWENTELIKILGYINNNFDTWSTNHLNTCLKAIEATSNKRDAKAVYNKIHSLIKAYDDFLTSGNQTQNCSIIWDDNKIHDLVRKIYNKTKDKKKKDDQEKKKKDENQGPKGRKKKENKEKETNNRDGSTSNVDDDDVEMANCSDPATPTLATPTLQSTVNGHAPQIPFPADLVEKLFNEKSQEIDELRTKLIQQAKSTNSLFEQVNFQMPVQIEPIDKTCNEKIEQITRLKDQLLELLEKTNNKYNQLKDFK